MYLSDGSQVQKELELIRLNLEKEHTRSQNELDAERHKLISEVSSLVAIVEHNLRHSIQHLGVLSLRDDEVGSLRVELQRVQAELNVKAQRNSEVNNIALLIVKHLRHDIQNQAVLSLRDDELKNLHSKLQRVQAELDVERAQTIRGDSEVKPCPPGILEHL